MRPFADNATHICQIYKTGWQLVLDDIAILCIVIIEITL